jgi:hypothetical protein
MKMTHVLLWGLAMLLSVSFTSCSVKEDRTICPCRLVMDFSDIDTFAVRSVRTLLADGETVVSSSLYEAGVFAPELVLEVPRTKIALNVYAGLDSEFVLGKGLQIPLGEDCPELYMHSALVDAEGESVSEKILLHKNFCRMRIEFVNTEDRTCVLRLKSNVCGYDMNGNPMEGSFAYEPHMSDGRKCEARLPRQTDSSMLMEIDDGTGVQKSFSLGGYIAATGYDWTAEDLADIDVVIDWSASGIRLRVQDWESVHEYEIVM